jgi:hypothetical protein
MPDPYRGGPSGWSRCFISKWQNERAGFRLGLFYADQRMLTRDRFQIRFLA